jgi:hypothetical protein
VLGSVPNVEFVHVEVHHIGVSARGVCLKPSREWSSVYVSWALELANRASLSEFAFISMERSYTTTTQSPCAKHSIAIHETGTLLL